MKKIQNFFIFPMIAMVLFIALVHLPLVPQVSPYEALTTEGGFYGVDYKYESLRMIFSDLNCSLNCLPHNNDTRQYNLIAIVIASLLTLISPMLLAVLGGYGLRSLRSERNLATKRNIFVINHSKFGKEEFKIINARYNLYKTEKGVWEFTVNLKTGKALKRSKELKELIEAHPHFEATAILHPDDLELKKGKKIFQKEAYDDQLEENLSNIYYFEHTSVEALEVEIKEVGKRWIVATIKGQAAIDDYSTNKPDADLLAENVKFIFDENLEREVM